MNDINNSASGKENINNNAEELVLAKVANY